MPTDAAGKRVRLYRDVTTRLGGCGNRESQHIAV